MFCDGCVLSLNMFTLAGSPIPLILNFFVFTPGVHVLTVQLTDSAGSSQTFIYSFTGKTVPGRLLVVSVGIEICIGCNAEKFNYVCYNQDVWRQY